MKHLAVYSLLLIMLVLAGCPVLTKNSIDEGSYEIPSWLTGTWREVDKEGKMKNTYVFKKEAKKGNLICLEADSTGKPYEGKSRKVVMSTVDSKVFLCAFEAAGDMNEEGYYIFEFRKVNNKEFILAGIKEHEIDYDAPPADIKAFLLKNKDNTGIYDAAETSRYVKQ